MWFRDFASAAVKKLVNKSPLNYPVVRHMSCLDPVTMATRKESAVKKIRLLLPLLAEAEQLDGGLSACDHILQQYRTFLEEVVARDSSFASKPSKERLDSFFYKTLG